MSGFRESITPEYVQIQNASLLGGIHLERPGNEWRGMAGRGKARQGKARNEETKRY